MLKCKQKPKKNRMSEPRGQFAPMADPRGQFDSSARGQIDPHINNNIQLTNYSYSNEYSLESSGANSRSLNKKISNSTNQNSDSVRTATQQHAPVAPPSPTGAPANTANLRSLNKNNEVKCEYDSHSHTDTQLQTIQQPPAPSPQPTAPTLTDTLTSRAQTAPQGFTTLEKCALKGCHSDKSRTCAIHAYKKLLSEGHTELAILSAYSRYAAWYKYRKGANTRWCMSLTTWLVDDKGRNGFHSWLPTEQERKVHKQARSERDRKYALQAFTNFANSSEREEQVCIWAEKHNSTREFVTNARRELKNFTNYLAKMKAQDKQNGTDYANNYIFTLANTKGWKALKDYILDNFEQFAVDMSGSQQAFMHKYYAYSA